MVRPWSKQCTIDLRFLRSLRKRFPLNLCWIPPLYQPSSSILVLQWSEWKDCPWSFQEPGPSVCPQISSEFAYGFTPAHITHITHQTHQTFYIISKLHMARSVNTYFVPEFRDLLYAHTNTGAAFIKSKHATCAEMITDTGNCDQV